MELVSSFCEITKLHPGKAYFQTLGWGTQEMLSKLLTFGLSFDCGVHQKKWHEMRGGQGKLDGSSVYII